MVLQKQELIRQTIYELVKLCEYSQFRVQLDENGITSYYERKIDSETVIQSKNVTYIKNSPMSDNELYQELADFMTKLKELNNITDKSKDLISREERVQSEDYGEVVA